MLYLLKRHGTYFRPNAAGYTTSLAAAGLYTRAEADRYRDVDSPPVHEEEATKKLPELRERRAYLLEEVARLDEMAAAIRRGTSIARFDLPQPGDYHLVAWPYQRDEKAIKENREYAKEHPDQPLGLWEWKPGMRYERPEDWGPGEGHWYADAMGQSKLHVLSTHKPGPRYSLRIFYKQTWIDPEGKAWGKGQHMRVCTLIKWRRISQGIQPDDCGSLGGL